MGFGIKLTILSLVIISSFFVSLPEARGGCAGGCSVGGGGASTSFMGDRAVNIGMSSFDEFVRDKLASNPRATLQAKSLSNDTLMSSNSSLNQSSNGNCSRNSLGLAVMPMNNSTSNTTSDNRTVSIGAHGAQESKLSTMAFAIFNKRF